MHEGKKLALASGLLPVVGNVLQLHAAGLHAASDRSGLGRFRVERLPVPELHHLHEIVARRRALRVWFEDVVRLAVIPS